MTKEEKATWYAREVCGEYFSELLNGCDETLGEVAQKDYLAGYNQAVEDSKVGKFVLSEDWTKPDKNETVDVPDHLMPLLNKIGTQLRLHAISGKSEVLTAIHILRQSEVFFLEK